MKPCAASVPEMPEPGTAPEEPAKISKSEAKNDLARRLVLAAGQIIDNADGSEAFLSALTVEEAAQFLANWLHSLPTGGRDPETRAVAASRWCGLAPASGDGDGSRKFEEGGPEGSTPGLVAL